MAEAPDDQETDVVLSSVHIGTAASANLGQATVLSEFSFTPPLFWGSEDSSSSAAERAPVCVDEDGDLDVPRRHASITHVLIIEHTMATPISGVGAQLWSGALLLSDYLIDNHSRLADQIVLELGSGVGLVGVVTSQHAKQMFCTDIGDFVLGICQRNLHRNCPLVNGHQSNIAVRELDWRHPVPACTEGEFSWTPEDQTALQHTSLVLAADVIYDDSLTDAFFNSLAQLTSVVFETPPTVLVAMEKRINFSLEHMDVVSPAHSYFLECLKRRYPTHASRRDVDNGHVTINATQLSTGFEQYFSYERVKELELWQLQLTIEH